MKNLDDAKSRLGDRLDAAARRTLGITMLTDVLNATDPWAHRWLVTADSDAKSVGSAMGCEIVNDSGGGLNHAVERGTLRARQMGAATLLVLPCDLPLVSAEDIKFLFEEEAEVVIAPSSDGGTSALLRRPPNVTPASYGPGSAARHAAAASSAGLSVKVVALASLSLDIDTPDDLAALAGAASDRLSVRLAKELLS